MTQSNATIRGGSVNGHGSRICSFCSTQTISNSLISNNFANCGGGGYVDHGSAGMINTTITGNGSVYGGSVCDYAGSVTLTNTTVTGNNAFGHGGGITGYDNADIGLANSIVSGNTTSGSNPDLELTMSSTASSDYSLLGTALSGAYAGHGNIYSDDPKLYALADNGGPTPTMALHVDSPAVDAGNNALVPGGVQYDQRGPGYPRIYNGSVDIGAFEYRPDEIFADGFDGH